ncbi:Hypothetical_protein [Hexamita inflata]|uniref:Hypothetical_protein n=1 Tax=Hexamita inflata TaxID=28002 RepID=A0AA86TLD7_9EUKA|nr:Hypothetical protein HINF_LOCUS8535 [Hexamita inflata]CAI9961211.1 Hypothetical protein HINF_LOCUS48856 [Hexamita inflata]CAI9963929.1 Hypothetical protein HINF_LOCUS51574 [Hexamita inflata]
MSIINSPAPTKQIISYATSFIPRNDVKRQKMVSELDKAEKRGDIYFGTDYYYALPVPAYDVNQKQQMYKPVQKKINEVKSFTKPVFRPRFSAGLMYQQVKNVKEPEKNIQVASVRKQTKLSYSEALFFKELDALEISDESSSDDHIVSKSRLVNRSGELIHVQQNNYSKSDKIQHTLSLFNQEIEEIQNQLNQSFNQSREWAQ